MPTTTDMRSVRGFTLVEVLIALAVVALVLVALLGSMQAVVASATNIYDRTLAGWIAVDKVTEYRLVTQFPEAGEESGEVEMANLDWVYSVTRENISQSADIITVTVKVAAALEPEIVLGVASGTLIRPSATAGIAGGPPPGVTGTPPPGVTGIPPGIGGPPPGVAGGSGLRANGVGPGGPGLGGFAGPDTRLPPGSGAQLRTEDSPAQTEGDTN